MEKNKQYAILFIIVGIFFFICFYYSWFDGRDYINNQFPGGGVRERNDFDFATGNILQKIGLSSLGLGLLFFISGLILLQNKK